MGDQQNAGVSGSGVAAGGRRHGVCVPLVVGLLLCRGVVGALGGAVVRVAPADLGASGGGVGGVGGAHGGTGVAGVVVDGGDCGGLSSGGNLVGAVRGGREYCKDAGGYEVWAEDDDRDRDCGIGRAGGDGQHGGGHAARRQFRDS